MSELLKALLSRKVTRMCLHGILLAIGIHLLASSVVAQSTIRTYAGGDIPAGGATALTQNIVSPGSVTSDGAGGFFFASNSTIFRVDAAGTLTRVAGKRVPGSSGDDGPAISAQFSDSLRLALDSNGSILIADYWDHRIRRITPDGIMRTVAGTGGLAAPRETADRQPPRRLGIRSLSQSIATVTSLPSTPGATYDTSIPTA